MTTLIGTRWKRSNALSQGILIRQQNTSDVSHVVVISFDTLKAAYVCFLKSID